MTDAQIVKDFISMWPREVWDVTEEDKGTLYLKNFRHLQQAGIYVLYREETPYYIGQAKVLYKRLHDHANKSTDRYFNFWNFFSAFVVSDEKYLDDVERILIAAMPTANSSMPKMNRIRIPDFVGRRMRQIRRHAADPLTRRDLQKLLLKVGIVSSDS